MKALYSVLLLILGLATAASASAQLVTNTYNFTGAMQTFTMPVLPPGATVSNLTIQAWGAQGGSGATGG